MIVWWRRTPSNVAPMPSSAVRDALVAGMGLELDPLGAERLERVASAGGAWPRGWRRVRWNAAPTHVQPISSRRCSGAIVMNRVLPMARPDARSIVAKAPRCRPRRRAGRCRTSARSAGVVHRPVDRPAPDGSVEGDAARGRRDGAHRAVRAGPRRPVSVTGVTQVWRPSARMVAAGRVRRRTLERPSRARHVAMFSDAFAAFLDAFFELRAGLRDGHRRPPPRRPLARRRSPAGARARWRSSTAGRRVRGSTRRPDADEAIDRDLRRRGARGDAVRRHRAPRGAWDPLGGSTSPATACSRSSPGNSRRWPIG